MKKFLNVVKLQVQIPQEQDGAMETFNTGTFYLEQDRKDLNNFNLLSAARVAKKASTLIMVK